MSKPRKKHNARACGPEPVVWVKKVWGLTAEVMRHPVFEVHAIKGCKGGYCSRHHHIHKWNLFYVVSGRLAVIEELPGRTAPIKSMLPAGQSLAIAPGRWHRFVVLEDNTQAIEVYWAGVDHDDIIRATVGGMMSQSQLARIASCR